MMKFVSVLCAVLFLGFAAYFLWPNKSQETTGATPSAAPATPVSVMTLRSQRVDLFQDLPGRIVAFETAEIRPQVTGIITERLFTEGSRVQRGEQLYQIDAAPYEATHQSAEADLAKAMANVKSIQAKANRYAKLVEIDAVSRQEVDDITASLEQAKADVAIAEAALVSAQIALDYTKVYAPITGQIGKSFFTKGALLTANQSQYLTRITQLDPIYVDVVQASIELSGMRQSLGVTNQLEVELHFEDQSKGRPRRYEHVGKLQFADVNVDQTTGSVLLRTLFPNPDRILLPGMFVRTRIKVGSQEGILVPQRATSRGADGFLYVWVVNVENKVEKRTLHSEKAIDNAWLVLDGLDEGERIVTKGIQKVQPGALVDPTNQSSLSAASTSEEEAD